MRRSAVRTSVVFAMLVASCVAAPVPASTAQATRTPAGAPSASATPVATSSPSDLLPSLVEVTAQGWAPSGPAAIVSVAGQRDMRIVAVPLAGGPAVQLAAIHDRSGSVPAGAPVSARADGQLLAISLATTATTRRVALVDLGAGHARWLSTPANGESDYGVAWAPDGGSVYFGRMGPSGDGGVIHLAIDGTSLPGLAPTTAFASSSNVSRVTLDGNLIGSDELNGPTLWVTELTSGRKVSYGEHYSLLCAWRATRPRALVSVITSLLAPGAGYLAIWEPADGTKRTILASPVGGCAFDPSGSRIVASVHDVTANELRLVVMNADGSEQRMIPGTELARDPVWTESGIVYWTYSAAGPNEVRLIGAEGGTQRTLYSTAGTIQRVQLVASRSNP